MDCTGIDSPNLNCLSESGSERVREEVLWAFFFLGGGCRLRSTRSFWWRDAFFVHCYFRNAVSYLGQKVVLRKRCDLMFVMPFQSISCHYAIKLLEFSPDTLFFLTHRISAFVLRLGCFNNKRTTTQTVPPHKKSIIFNTKNNI